VRTLLAVLFCLLTSSVLAQDVAESEGADSEVGVDEGADARRRAREIFEEAMPLLHARRYVEARDLLRDSLALYNHQATAYNLAMVQRELGEATIAAELIARLLGGEFGQLSAEETSLIHELRGHVEADLARITVALDGPEGVQGTVLIDDEERGLASEGPFAANPGEHMVRVASEGYDVLVPGSGPSGDSALVNLRRGQEITLRFALTPRPIEERLFEEPPPRKGWIAGVVIGVALAVGAGVALGVYYAGQSPSPEVDPVFGRTDTLRSHP